MPGSGKKTARAARHLHVGSCGKSQEQPTESLYTWAMHMPGTGEPTVRDPSGLVLNPGLYPNPKP